MRVKYSVLNVCIALVLVVSAFASAQPVQSVIAGVSNIRVSQVYGGGGNTGATYKNDFIELYNPTASPVSLAGWSVQYASAAGTTWQKTDLAGSIPANGYYLVQEAQGAGGTVLLPTPDATGTILMSATAGKVALVSNITLLTGGCPLGGAVMDFVGYGSADCYEGGAAAPLLTNTTSDSRLDGGCYDSDINSANFTAGAVNPRNSASPVHLCGTSPVVPVCPTFIRTQQNTAITAGFSASDADGIVVTAAITEGGVTGISLTSVTPAATFGGTLAGTLSISADTPASVDPYEVEITFTNNDPAPQTASCSVEVLVIPLNCPPPLTPILRIGDVQGTGTTSPYVDQIVTVLGTVTADFQANDELKGYFLQDQGDSKPATSDGIFVYDTSMDVLVGDKVMFEGTVAEYNGLTELKVVGSDPGTLICGVPLPMPGVTAISLPQSTSTSFEAYEGMRVSLSQTLTVSQNYFQGRYGQLTLSSGGRMYHPNNGNELGDTVELNARRFIVLDDGSTVSNPNPVPYYDLAHPLRAGDTTVAVTGVMDQGAINATSPYTLGYRVHPLATPAFSQTNLRPAVPELIGHDLVVVGFNLYNFFTTLNDPANTYPPPYSTSDEPRGANNADEFERQVVKLIAAIRGANPDVLGVVEMEKYEGGPYPAADTYLLTRLNEGQPAEEQYAIIANPVLGFGGDFIKNTIYYKPENVTAVGSPVSYNVADPANPTVDLFDRYPVAQTFRSDSDNQKFTVVVNHLKSKSCTGATGAELDLGQGCWNARRTRQATALLDFVNTLTTGAGDPDVLLIGDYNAYGEEDPIDVFKTAGMIDMLKTVPADLRYTYVFDGQAGYLDQAIGTPSLANYVSDVFLWHINADEPTVIDYDNNYNPAGYYAANEYRSSDHDPVWVRLNVSDEPILLDPLDNQTATQGIAFNYSAGANFYDADVPQFDFLTFTASGVPAWLSLDPATGTFTGTPGNTDVTTSGPITITVRATDNFNQYVEDSFTLTVLNLNDAPTVANPLQDKTTAQGVLLTYQFASNSFADVDIIYGDILMYSASGNPTWFVFTPATRTFSGTPGAADVGGPYNVVVRATDSEEAYVEDTFTLTVTNVNDSPVLTVPLIDQTATEDVAFTFVAGSNFFDIDVPSYDTLTYLATGAPAWLTFNTSTGTFTGTPTNADVSGPVLITVRATDLSGLYAEDSFTLTVLNANDTPTLAVPLLDQTTAQGTPLTYQFAADSFADVDIVYGDSLTYTASGNPTWFVFTPATRTFSGTPGAADVGGPYNIVVRATDSQAAYVQDTFTLTVTNVNDNPVLTAPLIDQTATQGVAFTLTAGANFSDVDVPAYDTLTYLATGAPAWLTFNTSTGTFTGTPTNADVSGPVLITVRATDLSGLYAEDAFTLAVLNVNDAPTVAALIPDQTTLPGTPFSMTFAAGTFTDLDIPYGDSLSYSALLADGSALPVWLTFNPATRTFSGTPAYADLAFLHVKVVATDLALATTYDIFDVRVALAFYLPVVNK